MPPTLIAAGISAAASVGGALLSKSSSDKASDKATAASTANTASNNALAREIYGQNLQNLSPFMSRGNAAGDAINALLGLPGAPQQQQMPPMIGMNALAPWGQAGMNPQGSYAGSEFAANDLWHPAGTLRRLGFNNMQFGQPVPVQGAVTTPAPQATGTNPYGDAFQNFLNSTGFKFQMDQGNKAVNQGYAARGILQSGAAQKALQDRGQQTALNNYFLPYMNLLGQQQGVGLSGASAVAGVGQNYAGTVTANNNMNTQVALDALAAKNAANQQLYGGIGGAIGNLAGFASSYKW